MVLSSEIGASTQRGHTAADALEQFRAQQRDQIGTSLLRLVVDEGFSGAKVSALTQRAGISRKTFYKYFPSIESALVHTQDLVLRQLAAEEFDVAQSRSGLEQFLQPFEQIRSFVQTHPDHLRFLSFFDFALSRYEIPTEEITDYGSTMIELFQLLPPTLIAGQEDGSIRGDLDPTETALTCATAIFGAAQRCVVVPGTVENPALADTIMKTEIDVWRAYLAS